MYTDLAQECLVVVHINIYWTNHLYQTLPPPPYRPAASLSPLHIFPGLASPLVLFSHTQFCLSLNPPLFSLRPPSFLTCSFLLPFWPNCLACSLLNSWSPSSVKKLPMCSDCDIFVLSFITSVINVLKRSIVRYRGWRRCCQCHLFNHRQAHSTGLNPSHPYIVKGYEKGWVTADCQQR